MKSKDVELIGRTISFQDFQLQKCVSYFNHGTVCQNSNKIWPTIVFLADRTIGRTFGTLCHLSVTFCIVAKWYILAENCLKKWTGNQVQKVDFWVAPYFYFRFRLYGHWDGRLPYFARTTQQSVLDGTNGLSSSKPCMCCRTVWSELKPEVVLLTIINPERCKKPQNAYKWAGIALLTSRTVQRSFSVSCEVGSYNQK